MCLQACVERLMQVECLKARGLAFYRLGFLFDRLGLGGFVIAGFKFEG